MEACLLDHRFLCAKPSMIAAIAMYTSRRMLEGDWVRASLLPLKIVFSLFCDSERGLRLLLQLH